MLNIRTDGLSAALRRKFEIKILYFKHKASSCSFLVSVSQAFMSRKKDKNQYQELLVTINN